MRTWILTIFALAIPATGCTRNAATFYEEFVRLGCRFSQKCDKAAFKATFDDMADCRDDMTDLQSADDFESDCEDYDSDEAKKCLAYMRDLVRKCDPFELDDFLDECGEVCGDQPVNPPGSSSGGGDGWDGDGPYPPPDQTGG
jgi:hypothetical protein